MDNIYATLMDNWTARLVGNLSCYAIPIGALYILSRYLDMRGYFKIEIAGEGLLKRFLRLLLKGIETVSPTTSTSGLESSFGFVARIFNNEALGISVCFFGLLTSYLCWGVLQEKIMTGDYQRLDSVTGQVITEKFKDSQFLVLMNRLLAFLVSGISLLVLYCPSESPPLYKFSYASISNILSSWCQYEALKFISFPTQVLGKACKAIPVMLMGYFVQRKKYNLNQYFTAGLISAGVAMFLVSRGHQSSRISNYTTGSGVILMCGYLFFDSFTSNYQDKLFKDFNLSQMQMMCSVNLFSLLFTVVGELFQLTLGSALRFMVNYPDFAFHSFLMSICSAIGQMFIFLTISKYGAATFSIIMTVRMAASIALSALIYNHSFNAWGIIGMFVVFIATFLRVYFNYASKKSSIITRVDAQPLPK